MSEIVIWAHRGASAMAPENTLAAFAAALATGADGVELDVHLSRDGVPVVIHDETVDRTTNGSGRVDALSLRELQRLDAGSWFDDRYRQERIPSLEEVLASFAGRVKLNIEVKDARAGLQTCQLLRRYPAADVVISSFDRPLLSILRSQDSTLPLAVLLDDGDWHRALALARDLNASSFHPRVDRVSRPLLNCCRRFGLPVYPWTVDAVPVARSLVRAGASGLFTNCPACMVDRLDA